MLGVHAQDYKNTSISHKDVYTGVKSVEASKKEIDLFLKNGCYGLRRFKYVYK